MSIQVHDLDSVFFITANPELGWAQTLNSLLMKVQRFSDLELRIQIISKNNLHLHFFPLVLQEPNYIALGLWNVHGHQRGSSIVRQCIRPYRKRRKKSFVSFEIMI